MHEDRTITLVDTDATLFRQGASQTLPCLILYSGDEAGRRFDLRPGKHLVGRSAEAALRIEHPGVSRRHAELLVVGKEVVLRDLGSSNRSIVNGSPVAAPVELRQGDLVQLANVVLRFHDSNSIDALLHDRIYRLATTDPLTGVFNRKYLKDTLEREVARALRHRHPLSVICFDLDHFKRVNDTHGHAAGDQLLRGCAERVQQALRAGDVLCRVGGEEFTALLPDTGLIQAEALAERLRVAVGGQAFELLIPQAPTLAYAQTVSLGVAELDDEAADGPALLELADRRLYAAKRGGRNRVVSSGEV
jgi:two-component system, cell cycle response regulator